LHGQSFRRERETNRRTSGSPDGRIGRKSIGSVGHDPPTAGAGRRRRADTLQSGADRRIVILMGLQTARLPLRLITRLTALAGIVLWLGVWPAAAQGTPEQRAACEGDAMRLCSEFGGDVQRITACMSQKRRYLSPQCRPYFTGKRRGR
jgi:hypothetical protein